MRISVLVIALLIAALIARISQANQDSPPVKNERCNERVCVRHTAPLCLPDQKNASLSLIIRSKKTTADIRVTLTVIDSISNKEVERYEAQKLPRSGAYTWTFEIKETSKRAVIIEGNNTFTYTLDPIRRLCLTKIG